MRFLIYVLFLVAGSASADPAFWRYEWPKTDFEKTSLSDWRDVRSGGPGKDGIPALNVPKFQSVQNNNVLAPREGVIVVEMGTGPARAYPLRYLMWHEIVNDIVDGVPIAVTYCPLCNSALVFDRRVAGDVLEFGVTGKLRHSDMIMFHRQSESWWQQAIGEAIVGDMVGTKLVQHPSHLVGWAQFVADHPNGLVMRTPEFNRRYGQNPYVGYDLAQYPFLYQGENPPHGISPLERVIRVGNHAWPMAAVKDQGKVSSGAITISWIAGQASALDTAQLADGREVGSVRVQTENGSDVAHDVMFAFAFHAFWPDGIWHLVNGAQ